jgi:hypothetical protein
MPIETFCGIPTPSVHFLKVAAQQNCPILMSANAFWKKGKFRNYEVLWDLEVPIALDSSGFVAMNHYGGYRWPIWDYLDFATSLRPIWWAAMDYCVEPEIARNHEQVIDRIEGTVYSLAKTIACVTEWNRQLPECRATPPMPVLQGWHPADYRHCVAEIERCLLGDPAYIEGMGQDGWPPLVGVGSICRRQLAGTTGLMRIIDTLENLLPGHVKLHLFGIKSAGLKQLRDRPRIASVDSMAWNTGARWEALRTNQPRNKHFLTQKMGEWINSQQQAARPSKQLTFL